MGSYFLQTEDLPSNEADPDNIENAETDGVSKKIFKPVFICRQDK